jgi:hypothetical protein
MLWPRLFAQLKKSIYSELATNAMVLTAGTSLVSLSVLQLG